MIVIGDVHGCLKTLKELKKQLPHDDLCFTGDLIDRGMQGIDLVHYVMFHNYKCVMGNHEDLMLHSLQRIDTRGIELRRYYNCWLDNGGTITRDQYAKDLETQKKHLDWMHELPQYIEYTNKYGEKFVVSHSTVKHIWGLRNGTPSERDRFINKSMWGRDYDVIDNLGDIDYNIVGHTPRKYCYEKDKIIFVDTGCVHGRLLTAYDLETKTIYTQPYVG